MPNFIKSVTILHDNFPVSECYPFTLPVFRHTGTLVFSSPVTFFVGENGTGKSTLLEAMARAGGIHIWDSSGGARVKVNRFEKQLFQYIELTWQDGKVPGSFFGSETFRDFASILERWAETDPGQLDYFGGRSLMTQSHGQSIMAYFRSRYRLEGVYFLDEPETALSPRSQLELLNIIQTNSRAGQAQFIIASHSPILLACAGAGLYTFNQSSIRTIKYEETDHYKIYKDFLINRNNYGVKKDE